MVLSQMIKMIKLKKYFKKTKKKITFWIKIELPAKGNDAVFSVQVSRKFLGIQGNFGKLLKKKRYLKSFFLLISKFKILIVKLL